MDGIQVKGVGGGYSAFRLGVEPRHHMAGWPARYPLRTETLIASIPKKSTRKPVQMIGILVSIVVGVGVRILLVPILVGMGIFIFWFFPLVTPGWCAYQGGEFVISAETFEFTSGEWQSFTGQCDARKTDT